MALKVLLTDQHTPLGSALFKELEASSLFVVCASGSDALSLNELADLHKPAVVIDSSVLSTSFDLKHRAEFGRNLISICARNESVLVHFSSHKVFGVSQQLSALSESDEPEPDSIVGVALREVERIVMEYERSLIVRLPWVLDDQDGVLDRLCRTLVYGKECVVSDIWKGSPVFIEDAVRLAVAIAYQSLCGANNWGYFHLRSSDMCSEAELADYISRIVQKAGYQVAPLMLAPVEQRFIKSNGWLKGVRCTNNFGFQCRSWRQGIKPKVMEWIEGEVKAGRLAPVLTA